MAKTKQQKEKIVKDLAENLKKAKSMVFANFSGLKISDSDQLRKECKKETVNFLVIKKTLLELALKEANIKGIVAREFPGQISVAFSTEDELAPTKILYNFGKKNQNLSLLSVIFEGKILNSQELITLATIPTRQELLAKFIGSLASPLSGLIYVLRGNIQKLVLVLQAINNSKKD